MDEKPQNEIGAFIKHEYFNDEEQESNEVL